MNIRVYNFKYVFRFCEWGFGTWYFYSYLPTYFVLWMKLHGRKLYGHAVFRPLAVGLEKPIWKISGRYFHIAIIYIAAAMRCKPVFVYSYIFHRPVERIIVRNIYYPEYKPRMFVLADVYFPIWRLINFTTMVDCFTESMTRPGFIFGGDTNFKNIF